jgi:ring-1,2-phenylacetyl-CoA epoxidase subunit PaaD
VVSAGVEEIRELVAGVADPEIPVLTLDDLGIVRDVALASDGHAVIELTPTYSGCPAIDPIREQVGQVVRDAGYGDAEVRMVLAPAWTTDWISDAGREKLRAYGIAPPARSAACPLLTAAVACPRCGSEDTRLISQFGATPCQAHHVCNGCLEPFDRFKAI